MAAKVILFLGLLLIILGVFVATHPAKETISLSAPVGYALAQKIEAPREETFISALEYAQAFSAPLNPTPENKMEIKPTRKSSPKRHIAKTKNKKHRLVAKR